MTLRPFLVPALALALCGALAGAAQSQSPVPLQLQRVSADPFTNAGAEHATEVEPDIFAWGTTIVSTFQVGRYSDGGAAGIGYATSTDGGATWASGILPGITQPQNPSNPYPRASDPSVAYDLKHGMWLINVLPVPPGFSNPAVIVSRSPDGLNWSGPVDVAAGPIGSDKNWITCDNTRHSRFFGHCYVEWDDGNFHVQMNTSADGGQTWGPTKPGGNGADGLGGQPLVLPNGTVVVPFSDGGANELAIVSKDGGKTWSNAIEISPEADHSVATMRAPSLPSAGIDAGGTIYVAWHDCSFRVGCSANDIVMSTSSDGMTWTPKVRVPIDPTTSPVDHFIAGFGVDRTTSGAGAHLSLTYSFFPNTNCNTTSCRLYTGSITSSNGGKTWNLPTRLGGPMLVTWLANAGGRFVGDYAATTFTPDGLSHTVFAVGKSPSTQTYDEGMYTTMRGVPVTRTRIQLSSAGQRPLPHAHSDHARRHYPPKSKAARAASEVEKD